MFGSRFLDNGSTDSEKVQFSKVIQLRHFLLCKLLDIFASWPQNGGSSGPTVVYALRRRLIAILTLYFYGLHNWLVSCCCRGQLAHASRRPVLHERFRNKR